ncbi:hypothetical protein LEP3755_21890 [Leptolyngbya sp. NIES-3755]|nr:hypothetical protein LEP3755_21890 [Leptolyngbya sp. NIES-3755]
MKLPNGENAQLGDKVERYCLNLEHSRGGNKAILFQSRLGITLGNQEILKMALLEAAISGDAMIYKEDRYGIHYDIKLLLETEVGSSLILSCWIIRNDEDFPRLTNAYPVDR